MEKFFRGYKSTWMDKETFRLLPINEHSPFLDGVYLPEEKLLILISKTKHQKFEFVPKLDGDGNPTFAKQDPRSKGERLYKRERKLIESMYDYTLSDIDDIRSFLNDFADDFDFEKYLSKDDK